MNPIDRIYAPQRFISWRKLLPLADCSEGTSYYFAILVCLTVIKNAIFG